MARVILNNETFTVFNNTNVEILGSSGAENVLIGGSSAAVSVAQSIERVDVNGSVADFTYQAAGNQVNILRAGSVVATVTPQEGTGTQVRFADGSAVLKVIALGSATLGSAAIGTTAGALTVAAIGTSFDTVTKSASVNLGGGTVTPPTTPQTFTLTTGLDNLVGTAGNDTFTARIVNTSNTAQSADSISGGSGVDRLAMDIGTSQNFAITLETTSVEEVSVRGQANPPDTNNNNMDFNAVQIDAQRMDGVTLWESSNSRSDVIIEDVRIQPSQITKDITIAMVETDPGNVDFGVYFDQLSLRNSSASSSQLNLQVMDTRSVVDGTAPLLNSPYGGFRFTSTSTATGVSTVVTLQSVAIDAAQTYAELATAFQNALDAAFTPGSLTATVSTNFTVTDTTTGRAVTGQEIKISTAGAFSFTTPAGSGWLANGTVPANSGLHTNFNTGATSSVEPVTAKIILDDVGRGSTGGDLVVGGLSVGDTSTSKGVERFEITVRDNSKVQTINSTNNTLREVTIVNGATTSQSFAYVATVPNSGNLTVNGSVISNVPSDNGLVASVVASDNAALPGTALQHNKYGFSDVRLIDGSAMTGKLEFTAEFSERAVAKYLNLVDTADPKADTFAVVYTGGTGADNMTVTLDENAVASNSNINTGREDFTFSFNGGAGNDTINVAIDRTLINPILSGYLTGGNSAEAWYVNQAVNDNISIDGGAGNDTIRTPGVGNMNIQGGAGSDTIYADNTGAQSVAALTSTGSGTTTTSRAVFVFNTADQSVDNPVSQNLYDLFGNLRATTGSFGSSLTVTFKGLTAKVALQDTDYRLGDLEVNQAIKSAINGDAVLSKLLLATDGPSGTLVVTSLIDGVMSTGNLGISFSAPAVADLNATILAAYNTANKTTIADTTSLVTAITANLATMASRYVTQTADDTGGFDIVGAASLTVSDNVIDGGADNDVIVLGTTAGSGAFDDSSDIVVFSGAFGNDVIVNFVAGAASAGGDTLNLRAFLGTTGTTLSAIQATAGTAANTDSLITFGTFDNVGTALTAARNDSAAEIKLLYADDTTANKGLYIALAGNKGSVYQIVDGTAASDLTVTLVGSIDLADTAWTGLISGSNFA